MRILWRPTERRPDPEPLRTDDRKVVMVGTAVWVTLALVGFTQMGELRDDGRLWWLWTCLAGVGLGLVGLVLVSRLSGSADSDDDTAGDGT